MSKYILIVPIFGLLFSIILPILLNKSIQPIAVIVGVLGGSILGLLVYAEIEHQWHHQKRK